MSYKPACLFLKEPYNCNRSSRWDVCLSNSLYCLWPSHHSAPALWHPLLFIECYRTSGAKNYVHVNRVFMTMSHSGEESQANWTDRLRLENIAGNLGGRQWICHSLAIHLTVFRAPPPHAGSFHEGVLSILANPLLALSGLQLPCDFWVLTSQENCSVSAVIASFLKLGLSVLWGQSFPQ